MNKAVDTRQEKPTYIIYESGEVLDDPDFIDFYQLHQYDEILKNKLLGSFNKDGKYVLSEDMRKILVGVKKLMVEVGDKTFYAQSELKNITLHFKLKYWPVADQGYASLYLVERVDGNEIVSFVAQYAAVYSYDFPFKAKRVFNILDSLEDIDDEFSNQIEEYVSDLEQKQAERDMIIELQSEIFVNDMMDLLEKGGPISKHILARMRKLKEQESEKADKRHVYTNLRRQLLILIIEQGGFKALKKELPTLSKTMREFSKPVKEFDTISKKLEDMQAPPPSQNKKAKSASSSKKSAKSKSKAGPIYKYKAASAKSGSKKKDDKKTIVVPKKFDTKIDESPKAVELTETKPPENPKPPEKVEKVDETSPEDEWNEDGVNATLINPAVDGAKEDLSKDENDDVTLATESTNNVEDNKNIEQLSSPLVEEQLVDLPPEPLQKKDIINPLATQ